MCLEVGFCFLKRNFLTWSNWHFNGQIWLASFIPSCPFCDFHWANFLCIRCFYKGILIRHTKIPKQKYKRKKKWFVKCYPPVEVFFYENSIFQDVGENFYTDLFFLHVFFFSFFFFYKLFSDLNILYINIWHSKNYVLPFWGTQSNFSLQVVKNNYHF